MFSLSFLASFFIVSLISLLKCLGRWKLLLQLLPPTLLMIVVSHFSSHFVEEGVKNACTLTNIVKGRYVKQKPEVKVLSLFTQFGLEPILSLSDSGFEYDVLPFFVNLICPSVPKW